MRNARLFPQRWMAVFMDLHCSYAKTLVKRFGLHTEGATTTPHQNEIAPVEQEAAEVAEEVLKEEIWWPKLLSYLCCLLFKTRIDCFPPSVENQPSS